ncbi:hypothetical protein, variant 7 [Aphanomyces invadans]|uniref:BTB domain-containing protein n=1 Tax=Aphanomyces invadans TaxID=157072 RepID=A0A024UHS4_9STRA|nr:hypothetical protein, variant 7 [Aphanomyces invadans]ETW05966.1 hypothetical protein, variant 7 [Aphanomyces invadans]|eukprot:XP_008865743.1 hypothetical protein, variant 7 [Aphanomyces invadans]
MVCIALMTSTFSTWTHSLGFIQLCMGIIPPRGMPTPCPSSVRRSLCLAATREPSISATCTNSTQVHLSCLVASICQLLLSPCAIETLTWTHLASVDGLFPPGLRGHTANVKQPKIYYFGGYDGRGRSNELYILNTQDMRWERPPESLSAGAPSGRQRHSACLVRSKMYIIGGFDGFKWLEDTHVLDICRIDEQAIKLETQRGMVGHYRELLFQQDATYSDITFLVQGKPIVAHKAIVAAQSTHFQRMFSSGMRESHQSTIVITEWTHQAFLHMLEFLYTGYVENLTVDSALELLGIADHYGLERLASLCDNFLAHKMDTETVCHVLIAATHFQANSLKANCMRYLQVHFHRVVSTKGFEELGEFPSLLLEVTRASMLLKHKPQM